MRATRACPKADLRVERGVRVCALAVPLLAACPDRASLGRYEDGSSGAAQESGDAESGSAASLSSTSADDGAPARCPDGNGCADACTDDCGAIESRQDEHGCVRTSCQGDGECGAGERCFIGSEFGLCEGSNLVCDAAPDPQGSSCSCVDDTDCGGGHCVPEALWPKDGDVPFGTTSLVPTCGKAGDIGLMLLVRAADDTRGPCSSFDIDEAQMLLFFHRPEGEGPYELRIADGGVGRRLGSDGVVEDVWYARLTVDEVEETTVDARLHVIAPDAGALVNTDVSFKELPLCSLEVGCL